MTKIYLSFFIDNPRTAKKQSRMSKRLKKGGKIALNQLKSDKPNQRFDSINLLLGILFIGSLALLVWEISIYHKTFIPLKIPFLIWLLTGFIFFLILKSRLTEYLKTGNIFLQIFYCLVTFGGLSVSVFMLPNYYLADKEKFVVNEMIISTGSLGSSKGHCRQPFIIINHAGLEKQLVYYCDTPVEKYQSVDLTLSKGLFGFEVVITSEFKK
jgi:hypothetical protein